MDSAQEKNFYFFITNMESTRCQNSAIEQSKYVLNSMTKEFRELIEETIETIAYTRLVNNISHFFARFYYHLMNT